MKAGSYVVLLTTCLGEEDIWESSMPIGYVYKLRKNVGWNNFYIEKDLNGSISNGWSINDTPENKKTHGKLTLRPATQYEIDAYNRANGPVKANKIREYEIY